MFLLIPGRDSLAERTDEIYIPLCFYLYLCDHLQNLCISHLHSTMFLLIRKTVGANLATIDLHSTMFLLILQQLLGITDLIPNLHSTMFLLIPGSVRRYHETDSFTFHYVSTYTVYFPLLIYTISHYPNCRPLVLLPHYLHLSSSMFYFP